MLKGLKKMWKNRFEAYSLPLKDSNPKNPHKKLAPLSLSIQNVEKKK